MIQPFLRLSVIAFAISGLLATIPGSLTADDSATLESVTLRFKLPKGENKDDNTSLTCTIKHNDILIANKNDFANTEEFNDPGEYGPFALDVKTKVTKSVYREGKTTLSIQPHGGREHDTVIMNTVVEAKFSDGTVLTNESGEHKYTNKSSFDWNNK